MSCPAVGASGPSWPQPVIRPYTSLGLRAAQASGPNPSRSATPGRNPSTSTSAAAASRSSSATPSGSLRLIPTDRRPRTSGSTGAAASGPQASARSTRSTSAPRSERIMQPNGAGARLAISITRTPSSGPISSPPPRFDQTPIHNATSRGRPPPQRPLRLASDHAPAGHVVGVDVLTRVWPPALALHQARCHDLQALDEAGHLGVAAPGLLRGHALVVAPGALGDHVGMDVTGRVRDHQIASGRRGRHQPGRDAVGVLVVADQVEYPDQHDRDRPGEVEGLLG